MFDNEDWNVDLMAKSLDSSLFGPVTPVQHKHKKKKSKVSESGPNQSSLVKAGGKIKVSGREETDVTEVKKKKKRKRKKKANKITVEGFEGKVKIEGTEMRIVEKEPGSQNVETKKMKKRKLEHDSADVKDMPKKEYPLKQMKISKLINVNLLERNENENVHSSVSDEKKVKRKKKRKRKKDLDESAEPSSPKKSKVDDVQKTTESKAENGQLTRKERRNKRRKRNSKKNKYKHLVLASQEERQMSEISLKGLSPALRPENSKNDTWEVKDKKSEKDSGTLNKKKKKHGRKEANLSRSDSEGNVQVSKHMSEMLTNIKGKKQKQEQSLVEHQDTVDTKRTPKKEKGTKKQSFDVLRLKEIMSSEEKKMKTFMQEEDKKSAKRLSEKSLGDELQQQSHSVKNVGKCHKVKSPGNKSSGKLKGSTNDNEEINANKQTPHKQGLNVNKLKDAMTGENKKMEIFDKVHDKKKKKKENEGHEKSLREKMQERLNAARFRYLNEQLYTTTGEEAAALFADDDDAFHMYHQGYELQVSKWPVDPLTVIIKQIKARHKSPKTVIADMGCGSARLAQQLTGLKVHSFDLVAVNKWVTACNMSEVPLDDGSVDVVVFCLSLMGTNLVDYLLESNRILKIGGTMKIAEVESRFKKVGAFVSKVEKLGFEIVTKDLSNKMFYMFDFKKYKNTRSCPSSPKIELDPCVYKKR